MSRCFAQQIFSLENEFYWNQMPRKDTALINKFIQLTPLDFEYYKLGDKYTPTLKDLANALHELDLNNDGLEDIIFDGQSGGEPRQISIYINRGKQFKKIFNDYQGILKLEFTKGILSTLTIKDWGCCAEVNVANKFYKVIEIDNELKFKLVKIVKYIDGTKLPKKYCTTTKVLKILNNNYNLRASPVIDDTTEFYYGGEPTIGNTVGLIKEGSLGTVIGESIDDTGRVWYFVSIMPEFELKATVFYDSADEIKSHKCGWVSSRFVEVQK